MSVVMSNGMTEKEWQEFKRKRQIKYVDNYRKKKFAEKDPNFLSMILKARKKYYNNNIEAKRKYAKEYQYRNTAILFVKYLFKD